MQSAEASASVWRAAGFGRRIGSPSVRSLFVRFCGEVARFADDMRVEITPFEVRFGDPRGFSVVVSPLRELFLVSIGSSRSLDVRVSSAEAFRTALDAALRSFLEAQAAAPPIAAGDR
jgi:hypothetical protein